MTSAARARSVSRPAQQRRSPSRRAAPPRPARPATHHLAPAPTAAGEPLTPDVSAIATLEAANTPAAAADANVAADGNREELRTRRRGRGSA